MDCQPLTKKGSPHHKTTGVARANSIQAHTLAENMCCMGIEGRKSETIRASIGEASTTLIHSRLVISASSAFDSPAVTSRGSSAIPQMGQFPGRGSTICGCIGQVNSVSWVGAVTVTNSSAMPHFGQFPGACLFDLGMHGTGVFGMGPGRRGCLSGSFLRFGWRVLLWCSAKFRLANLATEIYCRALIFEAPRRL